jgi:hypothetical protein
MTTAVQQGEITGRATHLKTFEWAEWFTCQSCLGQEADLWAGTFLGEVVTICLCQKCAALLENDLRIMECFAERIMACAEHKTPTDRDPDMTVEVYGGVADITMGPRFVNVEIVDHDNEGR